MPNITLMHMCDHLAATMGAATGLLVNQSYNELTEGIPSAELPMIQVYPQNQEHQHLTFQGAVEIKTFLIHVDLYARQRSQLDEDMAKMTEMTDAIIDVLEAQDHTFFGDTNIRDFRWRWERVVFDYAGVLYEGARFYLTLWVF